MKYKTEYFFCSPRLLKNVNEVNEIYSCINQVKWEKDFYINIGNQQYGYQTAYNKGLEMEFSKYGWELKPLLHDKPKLIGDFKKNDIFVEIQFGNSATLYRDYYKFHYGLTYNLLSLAVLIVPTDPKTFFPALTYTTHTLLPYYIYKRPLVISPYVSPVGV